MSRKASKANKSKRLPPPPSNQIPALQVRKFEFKTLEGQLATARQHPFHGCWVIKDWQEHGITPVIVSRMISSNEYFVGNFLVDLYCLGVKSCYVRSFTNPKAVARFVDKVTFNTAIPCSVELAHEIIYGAIEFAAQFEIQPDVNFERCKWLLDPPDVHPRTHGVQFGKDGKPYFIAGPNDDIYKMRAVLDKLERTAGQGNFDFLIPFPAPE